MCLCARLPFFLCWRALSFARPGGHKALSRHTARQTVTRSPDGWKALYRGLTPSLTGIVPYSGVGTRWNVNGVRACVVRACIPLVGGGAMLISTPP